MNRAERRANRTAAMRNAFQDLKWEYHQAIKRATAAGRNVIEDKDVDRAYDRMDYVATQLADANYTRDSAAEDYKKWKTVEKALTDAGLLYSEAYFAAQRAFWNARYWEKQSYYHLITN